MFIFRLEIQLFKAACESLRTKTSFREKILKKRKSWQNIPAGTNTLFLDCGRKFSFGSGKKLVLPKIEKEYETHESIEDSQNTQPSQIQISSADFSSSEESEPPTNSSVISNLSLGSLNFNLETPKKSEVNKTEKIWKKFKPKRFSSPLVQLLYEARQSRRHDKVLEAYNQKVIQGHKKSKIAQEGTSFVIISTHRETKWAVFRTQKIDFLVPDYPIKGTIRTSTSLILNNFL